LLKGSPNFVEKYYLLLNIDNKISALPIGRYVLQLLDHELIFVDAMTAKNNVKNSK